MSVTPSEQRRFLNEFILKEHFMLPMNSLVYDIGKSTTWDYAPHFRGCDYKTVDRNAELCPSIVHDMELGPLPELADAIIFNGVFEQCGDPWAIMRNILLSAKPGARILLGLASLGMKQYGTADKWRVTREGALAYAAALHVTKFYELPEYYYVVTTV